MTTARKGLYASVRDLIDAVFNDSPPSPVGGMAAKFNALLTYLGDGLLSAVTFEVGAVNPEKFLVTGDVAVRIGGVTFMTETDGSEYPIKTIANAQATYNIAANKHGIILLQAGVADYDRFNLHSKVPADPQSYNTAALALAAKPAEDPGYVEIGYILIANNAGAWVAGTDDMTNGSDVTTATFVSAAPLVLPAAY